jgi:hypothetical protein
VNQKIVVEYLYNRILFGYKKIKRTTGASGRCNSMDKYQKYDVEQKKQYKKQYAYVYVKICNSKINKQ